VQIRISIRLLVYALMPIFVAGGCNLRRVDQAVLIAKVSEEGKKFPVLEGASLLVPVRLVNQSKKSIRLNDIQSSCGCSTLVDRKRSIVVSPGYKIAPGETVFDLTIDTSGKSPGLHRFSTRFVFVHPETNRISEEVGRVDVEIRGGAWAEPSMVHFSRGSEIFQDTVKIKSDIAGLKLINVSTSNDELIQAENKPLAWDEIQKGSLANIELKIVDRGRLTDRGHWVDVVYGAAGIEKVIRIHLVPQKDSNRSVVVSPPRLVVAFPQGVEILDRVVRIEGVGSNPENLRLVWPQDLAKVTLQSANPGQCKLKIQLKKSSKGSQFAIKVFDKTNQIVKVEVQVLKQ